MELKMGDKAITIDDLKTQVSRAEGFAEGFQAGYKSCAEFVAKQMAAWEMGEKNGTGIKTGNGNTPVA